MRVHFQEGNDKKTYAIQWTELLTTTETPFESLSELTPGTEVLAPYYDSVDKINYSIAIIGGKGRKEGEYIKLRKVAPLHMKSIVSTVEYVSSTHHITSGLRSNLVRDFTKSSPFSTLPT